LGGGALLGARGGAEGIAMGLKSKGGVKKISINGTRWEGKQLWGRGEVWVKKRAYNTGFFGQVLQKEQLLGEGGCWGGDVLAGQENANRSQRPAYSYGEKGGEGAETFSGGGGGPLKNGRENS